MKKLVFFFFLILYVKVQAQNNNFACPWVYDSETPISVVDDSYVPNLTNFQIAPLTRVGFFAEFQDRDRRTSQCGNPEFLNSSFTNNNNQLGQNVWCSIHSSNPNVVIEGITNANTNRINIK
jgi:hypothetical protein